MKTTLRCGIVGCGVIAGTHARALQAEGGVEVAWCCDLIGEKATALAEQFGIPNWTTDYRRVLEAPDVDFVCVCTDHAAHVPVAVDALAAGKDVLCEKALAADTEGVEAVIRMHDAHPDRVFGVVFQHRFDPVTQLVKRLVDEGALGKILLSGVQVRCLRTNEYYLGDAWRGTWAHEGGAVLINQAIHFIDLLIWLIGPAQSLVGTYANRTHKASMETEDTAAALLRFPSRAIGNIEATCSSHLRWEGNVCIHGTDGSLEIRNDQPLKVEFRDPERKAEVERQLVACREQTPNEALGKTYYGTGHPALIAEFAAAVRERRKPFVTVRSARHTMDVVLGIYQSHTRGGWVRVGEDP